LLIAAKTTGFQPALRQTIPPKIPGHQFRLPQAIPRRLPGPSTKKLSASYLYILKRVVIADFISQKIFSHLISFRTIS
jgi:hypothetical protein